MMTDKEGEQMKIERYIKMAILTVMIFILSGMSGPAPAQEINLDKMKKIDNLVCYPSLKDPSVWYYLPDQPRLAMKNNKPQFSFLKYSRTSTTGKAGTNAAQGGGIVHFLVTYGVSPERVQAAQRRLQEINPEARIDGPIVYRRGSFALITSFTREQESLVKTVAIGKAPLMEGQKAAVSMALTPDGAQLLWESFKSDTPDISLVFDMEFAGVREPYEATIEADWSRISKHHRLKAGLKYSWFGADVDMLFQELRQEGAIKITTKGTNAVMDKIIESANAKLLQVMFNPAPVDDLSRAAAEKNSYSNLNQAIKMMKSTGGKTGSINLNSPGFRQMIAAVLDFFVTDAHAATAGSPKLTSQQKQELTQLYNRGTQYYLEKNYSKALEIFQEWKQRYRQIMGKDEGGIVFNIARVQMKLEQYDKASENFLLAAELYGAETKNGKESLQMAEKAQTLALTQDINKKTSGESASEAYNNARRLDENARQNGYPADETQAAVSAYESYQKTYTPTGARANEIEGPLRYLKQRLAAAPEPETPAPGSTPPAENQPDSTALVPIPPPPPPPASTTSTAAPVSRAKPKKRAPRKKASAVKKIADKAPGFSLVASYQMKNIKRSGRMVYHMNHFRTEKQSFPMAENIGSLYSRYSNDPGIFRAVTIDDPVFKQREILVTLDGQDTATFTRYLNFVTVKMSKHHQSGETTNDEVVITPEKFNQNNNSFSLNYGYKDDTNRDRWLEYTFQVIWSFHGGFEIRTPWKKTDSAMLALYPPYRYRGLTIEGDGQQLDKAKVRHAVVTVNSLINGKQITTQATIKNQGPAPAMHLDIPESLTEEKAQVSITWYLKGGKTIVSPAQNVEGDIIYWDELPETERM